MEIRPILSALMRSKTGPLVVALQVAISLAILANAVHIVSGKLAASNRPSGLSDYPTLFHLSVTNTRDGDDAEQFAAQKQQEATMRAVPGVVSVTMVNQIPMSSSGQGLEVRTQAKAGPDDDGAWIYKSAGSLIKTWGLKLVDGRDFVAADVQESRHDVLAVPDIVIVTRAMAARLFPGQASVIGKTVYVGIGANANPSRIVGMVEHLQTPNASDGESAEFSLIFPRRDAGDPQVLFALRVEPGQQERVIRDVQAALRAQAPTPLVLSAEPIAQVHQDRYRAEKGMAWILITVSVLLLLITASGIVGMASLWVTQRRKQIGVRRALGARRIDILRYFIIENILITSAGVASGVLLAIGLNQWLAVQFEMSKLPLPYLIGGACAFWLLGVLAVYPPAWRGASTSPAEATRST